MSSECADKSKLLFLAQKNGVDFVFYDLFCELCKAKGVSVTKATVEIGLSRTIGTKWKRTGATPNGETLNKIADYFGVTTDFLLTGEQKEKAPALTEKDERDVAREVERIMDNLANSGDLMFDGVPMSEEAKASMAAAMKLGLEAARLKNKERFTPKKYRKD